jgi:heme o synthase
VKKTKNLFYASLASSGFAFCLMMLGAYTRLTDAGLGCPDWPACYGVWFVDTSSAMAHPTLHVGKAWTEMLHRYMAGFLGLGILGLIIVLLKQATHHQARFFAWLIGAVLLFQALLGRWTVTLKLWPVVVMGHLMGGMVLLSLLWVMTLANLDPLIRGFAPPSPLGGEGYLANKRWVRVLAAITLLMLILQIALGGWTSAHYAALVCPDFPQCHRAGSFVWDFKHAFDLTWIPGGVTLLNANALMTIHMLHRLGAALCALVMTALLIMLRRSYPDRSLPRHRALHRIGMLIAGLLVLQIALGIANVLAKIPLPIAVAHHAVSALLLLSVITLNVMLFTPHPALRATLSPYGRGTLNDYLSLCKPKVVLMMLITAFAGMCLSTQSPLNWALCVYALLGIGLCSASAAVLNHLIDRPFDRKMIRTQQRPMAQQRITLRQALMFASALAGMGFSLLLVCVNTPCAALTLLACVGYALIYSLILKHRTPQNIVIGGAAGAMPPLLGWVAMQGEIQALAWLPVLIIFAWTPPHFWALAIARQTEYQKAQIPMLPVTHGVAYTKLSMLLYTILLVLVSLLPYATDLSGFYYLIAALCLDAAFLAHMIRLYQNPSQIIAAQSFGFSIVYLLLLFVALLADHFFITPY